MSKRSSRTLVLALPFVLAAAACGDGGGSGSGGAGTTSDTGAGGKATTTASGAGGTQTSTGTGACTAKVIIAFFTDASCSAANKVGQRAYDTSLDCFSWTAQGSNAQENSATRFQCYNDRICYTQHPNTLTCTGGMGPTDKQAKNAECIKEPAGTLYSKLLSGNEGCPAPPPGFECPESSASMGTDGIEACTLSP